MKGITFEKEHDARKNGNSCTILTVDGESEDFGEVGADGVRRAAQKESGVALLHVVHQQTPVFQDLSPEAAADVIVDCGRHVCEQCECVCRSERRGRQLHGN